MSFYAPAHDPTPNPASQADVISTNAPWLLPPIHLGIHASPQYYPVLPPLPLFSSSPPPNHHHTLYAAVQLPPSRPSSVRVTHLSPYLTPGKIDWIIRTPPASALCPQERSRAGGNIWRQEDATSPPLPFMDIRVFGCSNTILVRPGPNSAFVTVGDVLDAVYRAPNCALCAELVCACLGCLKLERRLRHARSQSEAAGIPQGSVLLTDDRAAYPRPQCLASDGEIERWRWLGLVASVTEPDVWTLTLDARRGLGRIA